MIKIMKAQKLRSDDVQDAMVISVLVILMWGFISSLHTCL
jgi:hypothetical protein